MRKNLAISLALVTALIVMFTACRAGTVNKYEDSSKANKSVQVEENKNNLKGENTDENNHENVKENEKDTREVLGVHGETIVLPPAEEIKRVVLMYPEIISILVDVIPDKDYIVGIHNGAFTGSNQEILEKVLPNWENVETSFMSKEGYNANIEELLKLNPDLIIYDGKWQGEGMDKINVPKLDIDIGYFHGNQEKMSIEYERIMREIFDMDTERSLKNQWDKLNGKLAEIVDKNKEKETVLFIWGNSEQVSVMGKNSNADMLCDKLNLKNVADELDGYKSVNMEQIYEWNPDYIFVSSFGNVLNAKKILYGTDDKDWTKLNAFKHKAIHIIPNTLGTWIDASSDSPLMMYWLVNKCYSKELSDKELKEIIGEHYKTIHNVDLELKLIEEILGE